MFWVLQNSVYRRYTRCFGEFATDIYISNIPLGSMVLFWVQKGSMDRKVWERLIYRKPATWDVLRESIGASCAAITPGTLTAVVRSAIQRHRCCIAVYWTNKMARSLFHLLRKHCSTKSSKNCNSMSFCSQDIGYQRVSISFWTPLYVLQMWLGKIIHDMKQQVGQVHVYVVITSFT